MSMVTNIRVYFPRDTGVQLTGKEHKYPLIVWGWGGGMVELSNHDILGALITPLCIPHNFYCQEVRSELPSSHKSLDVVLFD